MNPKRRAAAVAVAGTVLGAVGLGAIAWPAGAKDAPELPAVSAEELVESVLRAEPPALTGTVEVDDDLGIPAVPGLSELDIDSAQVFTDGEGRGRVALRQDTGEKTIVHDGTTLWRYDSTDNSVVRTALPAGEKGKGHQAARDADPTALATDLLGQVRESSTVSVDGTATVADRAAYELVLTPKPTERTMLREVRVAVDAERRVPLRLSVLTNGTTEPALRVGFTDVEFGPQPAEWFTFTPPPGATVTEEQANREHGERPTGVEPRLVGEGWDTVLVTELPAAVPGGTGETDVSGLVARVGRPVSGAFGTGHVVTTKVGAALLTSDGRIAAGAVPEQVLMQALEQR
ncbi:hypothetical protein SAMN05421810_102346 [Amycolatopsis arida]|uniref:Outer membrane lipoprotein-sorting protein n=1 Tax=Amycolatopsis arida TaxID=587909 RepID=A0A1I5PNE5_9PSEU|nr:outer membrane lipoprotein carrier protein LolA [Amycolatopsis arida]TDX98554.1 hypothetical protein CLV69_101346 [Amycolatopsis arida]SFP35583.1 hypothetical protein SAMN05421810_102346 [Amycolatopsis arida]